MGKKEEKGECENFFDIHKTAGLTLENPFIIFFYKESNIQNLFVDYNRELVSFCHSRVRGNVPFLQKDSRKPRAQERATINSHYLDWGAKGIILKEEVLDLPLKIASGRRERGKKETTLSVLRYYNVNQNL